MMKTTKKIEEKKKRLAVALRRNLHRRKYQQRAKATRIKN